MAHHDPLPQCSFCHKSESEVAKLISNPPGSTPRVYICDECIAVCHLILEEGSSAPRHPAAS